MIIPDNKKDLVKKANEIIDVCMHSLGNRQARYRQLKQWIETGRANGTSSLHNRLYAHTDRLSSYLFSPSDLRFSIDYENYYPKEMLLQGEMASRVLTREWERNNIDITFGEGVKVGLDYGACLIKALAHRDIDNTVTRINSRLVMPWMFGVYNENVTTLSEQEAMVEVAYLTLPQAWRRIAHLPDAENLYRRIKASASPGNEADGVSNFFHQILSTSQLQTSVMSSNSPIPGGIVSLGNNTSDVTISSDMGADTVKMYEIWAWDDTKGDYVTIQMFDPDILIAPLFKKSNLYCPDSLPYGLIQPNSTPGFFWGRSEIIDLIEPQGLLSEWLDDYRRLMGVQYDKLLAFSGGNGITDEMYDQFRQAGYIGLDQNSRVEDLTPKIPEQALTAIEMIIKFMEEVSGFGNILSGQGEAGVRSGNHAGTLMKTASPRLRDRSILIERQCATFAEITLNGFAAKNDKVYWVDPSTGSESEFLLAQLPDDHRVAVDSHSTSPIYADDHKELVAYLMKSGIIGGDSALDLLAVPMRDLLKERYKEMQQQKQKMIREHPELLTKGKGKK